MIMNWDENHDYDDWSWYRKTVDNCDDKKMIEMVMIKNDDDDNDHNDNDDELSDPADRWWLL